MDSLEVPLAITLLVIICVGVVVSLVGYKLKKHFILILGLGLIAATILTLFVESDNFRNFIVAFAAVTAVVISAFSFNESTRLRKDQIEHEKRDRKER